MSVKRIVGIDFGTSTSVIRVKRYSNGQPVDDRLSRQEVIFHGDRPMVPTAIQRTDKGTYYGYDALISKKNETLFQNFKVDWENPDPVKRQDARDLTEEFFAYMAKEYKSQSEEGHFSGPDDEECTIVSYPVKWDDETKAFIIRAAGKAGFKNVEGMDEAQAAIHAVTVQSGDYLMKHGFFTEGVPCHILLMDMGAGTTDLVLCRHTPGKSPKNEIKCTWPQSGDALFGGREVDEILRGYIRSLLPEDQADVVLKKNGIKEFKIWKETVVSPALARSETVEEFSSIDNIVDLLDIDMEPYNLGRSRFEELAEEYLAEFPGLIAGCIDSSGISKEDIDLVILTGGHSQWYFVKEMLTNREKVDLPKIRQNPDRVIPITRPQETVALGMVYRPLSAEFQKEPKQDGGKGENSIIEYYRKNIDSLVARYNDGWLVVRPDGTIAASENSADERHIVANWKNIVAIKNKWKSVIGVKKDGTVVTIGIENSYARHKDIVSISKGYGSSFIGLRRDGTVEFVDGYTTYEEVCRWKDIVSISEGSHFLMGLRKDGTVVFLGVYRDEWHDACHAIESWRDIVSISCGHDHVVGLRKDGTVVAVRLGYFSRGQCNVQDWKNIVSISCGQYHTVGLRKDGTVIARGYNGDGQCDVENWSDIVAVCGVEDRTFGIKRNGTIIYTDYDLRQTFLEKLEGTCHSVPLGSKTLPWKIF